MITVVLGFGASSAYGTARFLEPRYQVQMLRNMLDGQESLNQATWLWLKQRSRLMLQRHEPLTLAQPETLLSLLQLLLRDSQVCLQLCPPLLLTRELLLDKCEHLRPRQWNAS